MHGSSAEPWVVTTPRKRGDLNGAAERTARRLGLPFVERGDSSFDAIFERSGASAIYVEMDEHALIQTKAGPIIYHEGTAVLRTKKKKEPDALLRALEPLPGDRVLDATLGMACDSLVIATRLIDGKITGLESNILLADLVARGLKDRRFKRKHIEEAARMIEVVHTDHLDFLRRCGDGAFDLVYFDPMFSETVEASSSMKRIKQIADDRPLNVEALAEAERVARRRIVVKGRRGIFEPIVFSRFPRIIPSGRSIFYGIIDV